MSNIIVEYIFTKTFGLLFLFSACLLVAALCYLIHRKSSQEIAHFSQLAEIESVNRENKHIKTIKLRNYDRSDSSYHRWISSLAIFPKPNETRVATIPKKPSVALFEADHSTATVEVDISKFVKNIRVFQHFETNLLLEMLRHFEKFEAKANTAIFKPGDPDDSIYIVQDGRLIVQVNSDDGPIPIKFVNRGESVFSLISILDILSCSQSKFRTVSANAVVDSLIVKLNMNVFKELFDIYPESWTRAVQMIVLNLQRVTFDTLHNFFCLTQELLKPSLKIGDKKVERHPSAVKIGKEVEDVQLKIAKDTEVSTAVMKFKEVDRKKCLKLATARYATILGLEKTDLLDKVVSIRSYPPGFIICEQGSHMQCLCVVVLGSVEMLQTDIETNRMLVISKAFVGEMVGSLSLLSGEPSFYTLITNHHTIVACLSRSDLFALIKIKPRIVLNVAHTLVERLSPFVRQVDFALSMEICNAGRALYLQDEKPDAIYIVLSGRMRAVINKNETEKEIVDEFGRSDVVELLTQRLRSASVISVRCTESAKVPEPLFCMIRLMFPDVLTRMIKTLGNYIFRQKEQNGMFGKLDSLAQGSNFSTIAVMSVSEDVPLMAFTLELWHSLNSIKSTLRLSADVVKKSLGAAALQKANEFRLVSWLNQQEETYPVVLYQCDFTLTDWTLHCVRQADCILIVANGRNAPTLGPVEKMFEQLSIRAQNELILLWPMPFDRPRNTADWLVMRGWVSSHYHIRIPLRTYLPLSETELFDWYEKKVFSTSVDKFSDFSRVARCLLGCSVGLVLGGGGARGAAHIGIIQALQDFDVPIDCVGGTSIGALIGGIYCMELNLIAVKRKASYWFGRMSSIFLILLDLTWPVASKFCGSNFNILLQRIFGSSHIEDLWIPYFNISTDITSSKMSVHRSGCLWRYCRASMTLAGLLPPLCNPADGHLLLDGAYVNNLPADVMRTMGVSSIIAVDIGTQDETDMSFYGDSLNGFWLLWKKWNPFTKRIIKVLTMEEIQSRLAYVSSNRQLEIVKKASYCFYIRPPIDVFQTLEFYMFDEIYKVGYKYGRKVLQGWRENGKLNELISNVSHMHEKDEAQKDTSTDSFTDLAALVSAPAVKRVHATYVWNDAPSIEDDELLSVIAPDVPK